MKNRFFSRKTVPALALVLGLGASVVRADVTYTLSLSGVDASIASTISNSMVEAVALYNKYGSFNKSLWAVYNAGVPTAQAGYGGYIEFGGSRNTRVALHEMGHTMGVGTYGNYGALMVSGLWQGSVARDLALKMNGGYADGLHGDAVHIWPWGLNYDSEDSYTDRIKHVLIMAAVRCDMGLMAYSQEAQHAYAPLGGAAEFEVTSPQASSYQWYKDGVALSTGGDISGATKAKLEVANVSSADVGSYYCMATGAGETLKSRARRLLIEDFGQWEFDGDASDSEGTNDATVYGTPSYVTGKSGQAITLDGSGDYLTLPSDVGLVRNMTISTWVYWNGGSNWQRIFDFGTGTSQYMFLSPKSGSGTLRFSLKDTVWDANEQMVETSVLPTGKWVHVAVVLDEGVATLYVDGAAQATQTGITLGPSQFEPTLNYVGKSQWSSDPLFNGRLDDFRVYNYALSGAEIWTLWGESENHAPEFTVDTLTLPSVVAGTSIAGVALSDYVEDQDGDELTFSMIDGPDWLSLATDGRISGTPGTVDAGLNSFVIRATDPSGASSSMSIQLQVVPDFSGGPIAYWDFNDPSLGATNGAAVPDSDGMSVWRTAAIDKSGNGNHLTTWDHAWAGFNWSASSSQGDFSLVAAGTYPAAYTWSSESSPSGYDVESVPLNNFTVEVIATTSGSGHRTAVGRDARNVATGSADRSAFYLKVNPDDHPEVTFVDENGTTVTLTATDVTVANDDATWYYWVVVKDGDTVFLYVDNELEVSTTVAGLGALATGTTSVSGSYHAGGWSVGRGLYSGGHTDRFYGHIDAVAISGVALAPGSFVTETFGKSAYELYALSYGMPEAAFDADADNDGSANGLEFFLGSDPTNPQMPSNTLWWADNHLSATYPFNASATDLTGRVEWTTNLVGAVWSDSGVTYSTNSQLDEIEANWGPISTKQLFLRLKVEQ